MKMKRVLSLLLALVMTMSLVTLPSYAEDEYTEDVTPVEEVVPTEDATPSEDVVPAEDAVPTEDTTPVEDDFSALTVAEQYAALMAMEDEAAQAAFDSLTAEQQAALEAYDVAQHTQETAAEPEIVEEIPAAVNYDKVAPLSARNIVTPVKKLMAKAAAPAANAAPTNGISFDKTVTDNGDGTYTIKLEAYTTGKITTSTETKPCDIILVLDRSTSMEKDFSDKYNIYNPVYELNTRNNYYILVNGSYVQMKWCDGGHVLSSNRHPGKWVSTSLSDSGTAHKNAPTYIPKTSESDTTTGHVQFYQQETVPAMNRMEALHDAATDFASRVAKQSPESRIAVVSFGQKAYLHTGNSNSTALLTVGSNLQTIQNAINGVTANENATEHGKGMELAKNILAATDSAGHNRVVMLITDGEPAPSGTNNWSSRVVKQTVENAYSIKHDYDTAVYCISVMPNTDASNPTSDMDKYMSYVSSNYPNARYTGRNIDNKNTSGDSYYDYGRNGSTSDIISQITPGSKIDTSEGSFYLTAGNVDTLGRILTEIATQSGGSTVSLGKDAVVRDVVTPYFDMPAKAKVSVKSYDCLTYNDTTGAATWSSTGTDVSNAVSINGATIDVSNFDFNRNFVAEKGRVEGDATQSGDFHGRKLVITFDVTPKEAFLGGNGVPTNESAGVFENKTASTPLATATVDPVDVPIKPVTVTAKDKNVYLTGNLTEDQLLDGVTVKCGKVDITDPSKLEDWQKAFVTIDNADAESMTNLLKDTTYTVTAEVKPNIDGAAKTQTGTKDIKVNVFTPEVNFKDSTIYRGNSADYSVNMTDAPVWKHVDVVATSVEMTGTKPTLSYEYSKSAAKFDDCTDVNVTVKIGTTDVTDKTAGDKQFTVHVLKPTVTATVNDVEKYYGESYKLGDGVDATKTVTWADEHKHSGIPAATGKAPYTAETLTLSYTTPTGFDGTVPAEDFNVPVKVITADGTEVPATITTKCDYGCKTRTVEKDAYYTVHVKTCTLTVKKVVSGEIDENQSFIFTVTGPKTNMQVVVQGAGSATVTGLPIGTYTVTENQAWSWRYTAANNGTGTATLSAASLEGNVTVTNTRDNNKWLSGDCFAINRESGRVDNK